MIGTGKCLCAVLFCRSSANCVFVVYLRGQIIQACVNFVLCFFLGTLIVFITIFRDIIVILFSLCKNTPQGQGQQHKLPRAIAPSKVLKIKTREHPGGTRLSLSGSRARAVTRNSSGYWKPRPSHERKARQAKRN